MKPLIEINKLSKIYSSLENSVYALNNINLKIEAGEFVSIMGPSGSGKSTLLHILGLLDRQSDGEYYLTGKLTNNLSDEELANLRSEEMGFVFQSFFLMPRTTVFENVRLPLIYSKKKEEDWNKLVLEAIDAVGLSHRKDHLSEKLSGGEKQRVAIARALVNNPKIIFADEPTGNLDSKSGQLIMEVLETLNSKGITIILITHESSTASHAERIIRIKDGSLEKDEKVVSRSSASINYSK